jgi:hypothetical protein
VGGLSVVGTGYLQKYHSTRLNTAFKRHSQQMKVAMKSIWTGEPNEKQREQRDFVLRHMFYQNRPCLLADYMQGHSGAAMRNKSEDVKELLLKGIQAVIALTTSANGRPTNEHLAVKRILLGSACLHIKAGQFTEAARLLDTGRCAISISTALALAIDEPELGIGLRRPNALNHALALPLRRRVWFQSRLVSLDRHLSAVGSNQTRQMAWVARC